MEAKKNREWRHEYIGMPNEEISGRLQKQFGLSQEEAEGYLKAEV